jgi:enoyl-CoA hydratase/carnithine racemase
MPIDQATLDVETSTGDSLLGVITLNRPVVHNAVDEATMARLESILDRIESEPRMRALILTGAGDVTFSAGGDLKYFALLETREAAVAMSERMQAILARLYEGERVVIAAVNGQALGGGCEMLTACHFRIAAKDARFSFRQAANGLITGWGGGTRLFSLVGRAHALDLLLTSRVIDATEALAMGLLDRAVPADRLMDEARQLARAVCANPALSVRAFLDLAHTIDCRPRDDAVRRETELFGDCWIGKDFRRILRTFHQRDGRTTDTMKKGEGDE